MIKKLRGKSQQQLITILHISPVSLLIDVRWIKMTLTIADIYELTIEATISDPRYPARASLNHNHNGNPNQTTLTDSELRSISSMCIYFLSIATQIT